jgi:hypothetical protein
MPKLRKVALPIGAPNALRSTIPVASHSTFQVLVWWRTKVPYRVSPTPGLVAASITRKGVVRQMDIPPVVAKSS